MASDPQPQVAPPSSGAPPKDPPRGLRAWSRLGESRRKGRIPFIQQLNATECGAACLAMVLSYYGKPATVLEVREVIGSSRDGTNAKTLLDAGRWYNLRARGVSLDVDKLKHLPTASVLHWSFSHFVVFERLEQDAVVLVDPGHGRRRVSLEEFRREFTGVALLFEPGEGFERRSDTSSRVWRYIRQVLEHTGHLPRILITSLMLQLFALAVPVMTGALVDRVVPRNDQALLVVLGLGMAALVVFYFLAVLVRSRILVDLRTMLDARMTFGFIEHLTSLPYGFFQRRSTGDLMARVNSNSTLREILSFGALSGMVDGLLVCLYLGLLLWANSGLGLLVAGLGILQVVTFFLSRRRQQDLMSQNLHIQARSDSYLVEMLSGIETLKAMGSESRSIEHWTDLYVDVLNVSMARGRLSALVDSFLSAQRLAAPLCVLFYGAVLVLRGELSLGTMLGLNALAIGFLGPVSNLMQTAGQLQLVGSYVERIDDVLKTPPEQDPARVSPAPRLKGRIEFFNVGFRYGPLAPMVLQDVSFTIEPGQFVAIVGRSGSGKSTLASLLMGLHVPTSGRILYDNMDLALLEFGSVRRQIGVVTQRPYLFGATIRANIALADPSLPLERIVAAAKTACIHGDIAAMPLGYETPLIDGGASLSGGQRQRLSLARALVMEPAILALDEATSALDAVTESRVQQALDALRSTRIVIAHRLSTVLHADRILVMDQGRVVEQGTHQELLARKGVYAELVAAQLGADSPPSPFLFQASDRGLPSPAEGRSL
ncbi:peptidase domain-containing ABC transporter [Pyxidicoccus sp. MSG2]|uniref:peptidase domain-containing ABC transporter n=1 Tax=Pyxidicoccus sp. MSG2 TaxID=2996790 RepID=UPI00226F5459|nr:peptidase domain-containing ABC transporter [Pyxidicoccus sp. MSG2]MCY1021712.1 peptidase domain-containing ABC transporter [Pyxidicoccus sp. MSG2]